MKNKVKGCCLVLVILLVAGCSKVVVKSDSDPNLNMSDLNNFHVRKLPADGRGIEKIIAAKLVEFGFNATSGEKEASPTAYDAIVTYKDRWMWDITMYMLEIDIQLRDPETEFVLATGTSYRTSLARKSPEEMVDEVLRDMFTGKVELPENIVAEEGKE